MSSLWQCLEDVHDLVAVSVTWRNGLAGSFDIVRATFLRSRMGRAKYFPCPKECGCAHEVIEHSDGALVAVCRCEPWNCEDIPLAQADVMLLQLNWSKLGRAIVKALGCDSKEAAVGLPGTTQVGSFGSAALPLVLTIQNDSDSFRRVVAELVARLRNGFILLAPTSRFLSGPCLELLAHAKAGFFDFESLVVLLPSGALHAPKSAGELFSAYLPEQEKAVTESEAKRVFELMKLLDAGKRKTKAPLSKVFRLYVFENCSRERIARECDCVPSLITKQFQEIERIMKRPREELRALATPLAEMQASDPDSRAKRIYQRGMSE